VRILVTGHHGYVGSVLAPTLRDAGHDVVGLDVFYYRACDFGTAPELTPPCPLDIRDVGPKELEGFDAVVHLAALSNDPLGNLNRDWTFPINFGGALAVARAAKAAGVERFLFASSCAMYGANDGGDPLDESAPLRPLTEYAASKIAAEEALHELADESFTPVAMRCATAYGVSPRLRLDIVLNNLVAWAHATGEIRLQSDGRSWRPLVHVLDIAQAALTLVQAPARLVRGEAFNIGSDDQNYLIRDLAEIVLERLPHCNVVFAEGASPDPRSYRVDFSRFARTFPQHRYTWTAERGVVQLADAYATFGLDEADLTGDRFVRINRLRRLLDAGVLDADLRWIGTLDDAAASDAVGAR
jgi:nucleoside-diphosphate-sugar epimerase